jgi:hypothetical protein
MKEECDTGLRGILGQTDSLTFINCVYLLVLCVASEVFSSK